MLVIVAVASSCKKYEEGPCISLRSPEKRLLGYYSILSYTINGEDSLSAYNENFGVRVHFRRYYRDTPIKFEVSGLRKDGHLGGTIIWSCSFNDKETNLIFYNFVGDYDPGPFSDSSIDIHINWEILRLTNTEVKLKTLYNNKEYVVFMVKNN